MNEGTKIDSVDSKSKSSMRAGSGAEDQRFIGKDFRRASPMEEKRRGRVVENRVGDHRSRIEAKEPV